MFAEFSIFLVQNSDNTLYKLSFTVDVVVWSWATVLVV